MMGNGQKVITTILWALAVIGMLGVVGTGLWARKRQVRAEETAQAALAAGQIEQAQPLEPLYAVPYFELLDQNGKSVTDDSLRGNVWVADFIFTHCAGPCPKMTAMMAELQQRVQRPDVKLISFTVDPERDTPPVLKKYADTFGADDSRWLFLTGTVEQMQSVARDMKIAAEKSENDVITHSTFFLLIDREGQVRGIYRQSDPTDLDRLASDALKLVDDAPRAEVRP